MKSIDIGKRLRLCRTIADVTQSQLAKRCRMNPLTLSAIETGRRANPRIDTLIRICRGLKCQIDDLVGEI